MNNPQKKICIPNTEEGSLVSLRQQFVKICYEQYQKHQNAGIFEKVQPIDIVIDVTYSDLNEQNFSNTLLQQINATQYEIFNKIQGQKFLEKTATHLAEKQDIENKKIIINVPFIVEVIVKKFLKRKGIENYEKIQWENLIVQLLNIDVKNEAKGIEKNLKTYTNNILYFHSNEEDKSISRLHNLYGKLTAYINQLIDTNKGKLIDKKYSVKLDDTIFTIDSITIAINDLYLRNPEFSEYTKTYWKNIIADLNNKKYAPHDILTQSQFKELYNYINNNITSIEEKYQNTLQTIYKSLSNLYNYKHEQYSKDISSAQLILAIAEKFLSNDGLYRNETTYWLTIIENLINEITDIGTILSNPEHNELKIFIYEDFLLRDITNTNIINLEEYKKTLIIELKRISEDLLNTTVNLDSKLLTSLYRLVYYSLHELDKGASVLETLQKYESLFLVLDVFIDISQFADNNRYPVITPIYIRFINSEAYNYLDDKIVFKLKNVLDEVVVLSTLKKQDVLNITFQKETQYDLGYLIVKPEHIFKFITTYLGQQKVFRNVVKVNKEDAFGYEGKEFKIDRFKYDVHRFSKNAFDKIANLNSNSFEFTYISGRFHYHYNIYIKDNYGENLFWFSTIDYRAFEVLSERLQFTPDKNIVSDLINDFESEFKNASNDVNQIDKLYASLPTAFFNREGNSFAKKDTDLENHLREILKGRVNETRGTNEEMAVVNIIKAMSRKYAYTLLRDNSKLVHTIFRKLHQYWLSTGTAYEDFSDYVISLTLEFGSQKTHTKVWFSNEDWLTRDIEIEVSGWNKDAKKITLKNYFQKNSYWFNKNGENNQFLSDPEQEYNPIDLIEMQTMINGKAQSIVKVPAFMLYHKVKSKTNWDTFTAITDIISLLSIYGAGRVLIAKGIAMSTKALAAAVIVKEISTKAIQQVGLTTWLRNKHPDLLKWWTGVDTAGDIIMIFASVHQANDVISRSKKLMTELETAGVEVPNKYKTWLEKAKKQVERLFNPKPKTNPEFAPTPVFMGDGTLGLTSPNFVLNFNSSLNEAADNFGKLLRGSTKTVDKRFKKELSRLLNTAKGQFLEDVVKIARGVDGSPQKIYNYILELERLKLKRGESVLTSEQIRRLKELQRLNLTDKKLTNKLLKYIIDAPTGRIKIKEAINRINKGQIYDSKINSWRNLNKKEIIAKIDDLENNKKLLPTEAAEARLYYNVNSSPSKSFDDVLKEVRNENLVINRETGRFVPKSKKIDYKHQKITGEATPITDKNVLKKAQKEVKEQQELKNHLKSITNKIQREFIKKKIRDFSENIAEDIAKQLNKELFKYNRIANISPTNAKHGSFDLLFDKFKVDGRHFNIFEVKGGTQGYLKNPYKSRIIKYQKRLKGKRAQQGTDLYNKEIIMYMKEFKITKKLAEDLLIALRDGRVKTYGVRVQIENGKIGDINIDRFF